jgi:hypothetical protein
VTRKPPLQLLPAPEDREPPGERASGRASAQARILAPGAPRSPGSVPFEIAQELRSGDVVVWWGRKDRVDHRPILWVLGAALLLLGFATLLAPELWAAPLSEVWKPLVPALAPAGLLLVRELLSRRTVVVTDKSVLVLDHRGRLERLGFRNLRRIRRDLLTGGVLLEGAQHHLRLPPQLAEDARTAIASQTRHMIPGGERPEDRLGWLP